MAGEKSIKKVEEKDRDVVVISPYTLYAFDNPEAMITFVRLSGENYNEWSSEMLNVLQAKRKMGFINGTLKKPHDNSPNLENWLVVNSMIVGWIGSSIEPKVKSTVTYISDEYQLWENLKQRFSVENKVRVHLIKTKLASCRQDGQYVLDYYGKLFPCRKSYRCIRQFMCALVELQLQWLMKEKKKRYINLLQIHSYYSD